VAAPASPAHAAELDAELAALGRAVQDLPYEQRVAWVLRELEGMGYAEIAEIAALQHAQGSARTPDAVYDQAREAPVVPSRPRSAPPPGPPPAPSRRSRRGPVWLVLVVLLAVVAALAGWYFGIARFTVTPGVIDLSRSAAQTKLDQSGLHLKVTGTAYSETVRKGFVVSTDPAAGDRVAKKGTVGAVLSLGPERHQVPDVRGRTLDDAQQMLDDARLAYGDEKDRYDEKVPKGQVVTSDPVPGTSLRRDTAVDIVVSKGPKPIAIPDFTGRRADVASQRLGKLGFKVDNTQVNSDTVALGRVISQSPASGNGVKGDVVSLVVSKGPVLVEVPNVRGMGLQAATDRLQGAGFRVQVRHASLYVGVMYVVGTDPSGGTKARKGSTVIVSIV